jgi:hypothetical protein
MRHFIGIDRPSRLEDLDISNPLVKRCRAMLLERLTSPQRDLPEGTNNSERKDKSRQEEKKQRMGISNVTR